jgi:uncharacterized protein (TIGR00369 family)
MTSGCLGRPDRTPGSLTPREQIAQFMRGEWTQGGFNRAFGYYGVHWQEGTFEIHWRATEAFTTGQIDVIHGGAIATLLDNAMGWATTTVLQEDETFATADLQIQFVRAAKPGLLKARGSVVRRTRALAFCESDVRDDEDALVARGAATCSIFKRR